MAISSSNEENKQFKRRSLINSKTALVTTPSKLKIAYRYKSGYYASYIANPTSHIHAEVLLWGMKPPQTGDTHCPDPVQLCPTSIPVAGGDAYVGTFLEPCIGDKEQSKIIDVNVDMDVLDVIAEVRGMEKLFVVRNITVIGTPNELTINEYYLE